MRLPSASQLDAALTCIGSAILPAGARATNEHGVAGTTIHAFVEHARRCGKAEALAGVKDADLRARCAGLDVDAIPAGFESEVAIAWNWRTGEARRLTLDEHRAYPDLGAEWFMGTFDLVGMLDERTVAYDDLKTGRPGAASESSQLRAGALFAAALVRKERGVEVDQARVGHLIPRFDGDGWFHDRADLDSLDLTDFATDLAALAQRIDDARVEMEIGGVDRIINRLSTGAHCTYCPALTRCPAVRALAQTAAGEMVTEPERVVELTPEKAGELYERATLLEKVAAEARAAMKLLAARLPEGLPLSGGKVLREVPWSVAVKSDTAKQELAALVEELEQRGEIRSGKTTQIRAVNAAPVKRSRKVA